MWTSGSSEDKLGRPALYLKPCREGFNAEPAAVKYLVYCVERVPLMIFDAAKRIRTSLAMGHHGPPWAPQGL
jgi:hypothetical protein